MALLTQVTACRIQDDNLIDPQRNQRIREADSDSLNSQNSRSKKKTIAVVNRFVLQCPFLPDVEKEPRNRRFNVVNRANHANMALLKQVPACRIQDDNLRDPRQSHGLCEADYLFAYRSPIVRLPFAYRSPTVRLLFAYRSPSYRLSYWSFSMGWQPGIMAKTYNLSFFVTPKNKL